MLNKFWENISSHVAERWLDYIFGPALFFWAGGLGLYILRNGWQQVLQDAMAITPIQQGIWIVLAIFILVFSSVLMQSIRFPILRFLEGYWLWPLSYLKEIIVALRKTSYRKNLEELRRLKDSEARGKLVPGQREKLSQLEVWVHQHPVKASDLLPTSLGNILRAREDSPARKYGLDSIICWPRLWHLLPESIRMDLVNVRASLDRMAELWLWGLFFWLWFFLSPVAVAIGLVWMLMAYAVALQSAMAYGDLLESAFDLHRFSLYDAMSWPRPKNSDEERSLGTQLTEYLWRGTLPKKITYRAKEK